jgi:multidrug resistance efflux pump
MKVISPTSFLSRLRRHILPILVWLCVVACVVGLFARRSQRFEVLGIAQGQIRQVAATCTGRLKSVPVSLFEQVEVGQTLAVVDTVLDNEQLLEAELKSQLAAATAEIEHLVAQLVPTQEALLAEEADREINRVAEIRRFLVDVEQTRLQIFKLRSQIASDQIILEDLEVEVKITEDLLAQEAVTPYELQKAKVQYDSLSKKTAEDQRMLEQAKSDLEQARQRYDEYARKHPFHPSVDDALDVIRKEISVQEHIMNGLLSQLETLKSRKALELKSPFEGVVIGMQANTNEVALRRPGENVLRRPGEVVTAGDPIFAVAEAEPSKIIAYVSEAQLGQVREKMPVELIKNTQPAQIAWSEVIFVGPTAELMPERLWRNIATPQWGRPIIVNIPEGLKLVPGEIVGIRGL